MWNRRKWLKAALTASLVAASETRKSLANTQNSQPRLLFTSKGRTGIVGADGANLRFLEFEVPGQSTWQPSSILPDGERAVFLSMEPRRDGPGKPFDEFYTQTPTHIWIHNLSTGSLTEICNRDRLAPFMTPALLIGEDRILVQLVRNRVGQIFSMNLDGSDAQEFTKAGEGLPYGLSLSPSGKSVAFHLATPEGYQVFVSNADGEKRVKIAAKKGHLYFGTDWAPDGQWITYCDCHYESDPGHDWADVCVGRPDGSENRQLMSGQKMWFGATYGDMTTRGGGSNIPIFSSDGNVLFPMRSQGAKVAWEYQPNRPDQDHFNRDYKPQLAQGGTAIVSIHPDDKEVVHLTSIGDGVWDFRATQDRRSGRIAFCRARTGEAPEICVMDANGGNLRVVVPRDENGIGADHPRFL